MVGQGERGGVCDSPPFDLCQRTFQFAIRVVAFCQKLDRRPGVNWTLSKQLLRSGTSIGANVEEAQAGQSRADFASKYAIARKEGREAKYWLQLLEGSQICNSGDVAPLVSELEELIKIFTSIVRKTAKH